MQVINLCDTIDSNPVFFEHYSKYWVGNGTTFLPECNVTENRERLIRNVEESEKQLNEAGFSTNGIGALLVVGKGAANGHAFFDGERFRAWFDIANFDTERKAKVFSMHELVHALHYSMAPEFYFETIRKKHLLWRELITEGIATYLTQKLWNISDEESLWADYLPPQKCEQWMMECRARENELHVFAFEHFDDTVASLFAASDSTDVSQNRAGYYLGLRAISQIVEREKLSFQELLLVPAIEMRSLAKAWLLL